MGIRGVEGLHCGLINIRLFESRGLTSRDSLF